MKWRQNELSLYKSFPQLDEIIVAVIDAKTSQQADDAAAKLYEALRGKPLIQRVWRPDDNQFFRENGILFLSKEEIRRTTATLIAQKDILQPLAEDPTLRGLSSVLLFNLKQVGTSERGMAAFSAALDQFSSAFETTLAGGEARVSWEKLLAGGETKRTTLEPPTGELRRIVLIKPVIDYSALQPGYKAISTRAQYGERAEADSGRGSASSTDRPGAARG